jgi:hypothetical protein
MRKIYRGHKFRSSKQKVKFNYLLKQSIDLDEKKLKFESPR